MCRSFDGSPVAVSQTTPVEERPVSWREQAALYETQKELAGMRALEEMRERAKKLALFQTTPPYSHFYG